MPFSSIIQTVGLTDRQAGSTAGRKTDRQTERLTDRQTDRRKGRKTDFAIFTSTVLFGSFSGRHDIRQAVRQDGRSVRQAGRQ